ncbi:glycosyltransferase [Metallosphaera sp.]|uniref:glycosyltransferase n=1 Tax=Metallosphaera sp. TaxID=2020860 RepID=UPI00317D4C22
MEFEASIILCTINEIENLPRLVEKIENVAKFNYQLVFVDDGSTDGTREYIIEYTKKHNNAKYVFNESKKSTLIAHYMGIQNADSKFIIIMDADLQHPPEKINEIYENLRKGYDIVIASRYLNDEAKAKRDPTRGLISRVAEALAVFTLKNAKKTTDPLSGYFGFKSDLKLEINEKWRGYKILLYILSSNPTAKVHDISYKFQEREYGESKVAKGLQFIRVYLTELILVKRIEIRAKKR